MKYAHKMMSAFEALAGIRLSEKHLAVAKTNYRLPIKGIKNIKNA